MSAARLRVGLLFGGASVEHEVSVVSARGVASGLDPGRYRIVPLAVTGEGRWLSPERSRGVLEGGAARTDETEGGDDDGARLVADPGGGGLLRVEADGTSSRVPIDVLFPVLHGWGGEDGRVQGLLDLAGIPCVGAGVLGSALGMDKVLAKSVFESRGLPVGPWRWIDCARFDLDPSGAAARIANEIGLPAFVKPSNGGSSVGVSRVEDRDGVRPALEAALALDRRAVVEAAIDAREIECAVLGNDDPEASVPGEILPSRAFYDYAAKFVDGTSRLVIPAPLDEATASTVRRIAIEAFRSLDLAGMARVDFFLERGSGRVLLNEVNTLPGFTGISMYPKLWEATGVPYPDLLDRLVRLALERAQVAGARTSRRRG